MRAGTCRTGSRASDTRAVATCIPRGGSSLPERSWVRAEWSRWEGELLTVEGSPAVGPGYIIQTST